MTPINSLSDNDSNKHSETGRVCVDKDVKGNYKIFYQHFSKINYLHWRDEIHQMMPENIGWSTDTGAFKQIMSTFIFQFGYLFYV